jgi:alkylation response protein AidB-like acyl-CoA dehydrogenase
MSNTLRNRYRADLREMEFQIFEQAKLGELLGKGPYENWDRDAISMTLQAVRQFAMEVSGPMNGFADAEGCRIVDGRLITPEGFKEAWNQLYELGFKQVSVPEAHGGQGGPHSLHVLVEELLSGSNTAFDMYSGLAFGASEILSAFATKKQKDLFLHNMLHGKWGGTMCLTEPQAGSDVGAASSKAVKQDDGRYKITGTKIFISGGDHDLTENIIHLVLARVEGAPAGTKGLTLFIVPRIRVNETGALEKWNDVTLGGIEHKMGINGSATCVLNFGENDDCFGEPVGGVENEGIKQMFVMMNRARLAVGIQGLGVASQAFLSALSYAKDRKQGPSIEHFKDANAPKVAIINHPDIKRSLLEMKARVEGIRALLVRIGSHEDRASVASGKDDDLAIHHRGLIELLTPIAKAYSSDQSFRVCEIAIQVHGGAGYIKDYGVEQDLRDSKIFSIYEGTNHIQALDLVARKLGQRGGANLQAFINEVQTFVDQHRENAIFGSAVASLGLAVEAVMSGAMRFMGWGMENKTAQVALYANLFLEMFSEVVIGYLLLQGGSIAQEALEKGSTEKAFYEGKKAAALWFAHNVLPVTPSKGEVIGREDRSALDLSDESFATV